MKKILVPDVGSANIPIIELNINVGDLIEKDAPLLTLESDKASVDVPAPFAGKITHIYVKLGDKISEGDVIADVEEVSEVKEVIAVKEAAVIKKVEEVKEIQKTQEIKPAVEVKTMPAAAPIANPSITSINTAFEHSENTSHASPSIRKFARELGADIRFITGSAKNKRITIEDVRDYIKQTVQNMQSGQTPAHQQTSNAQSNLPFNLLPWPEIDFTKFGEIEQEALSRIKKISGANLHRNWVMIPHVTNHDQADITDLEALRVTLNKENEKQGIKLTLLPFLMKAAAVALKQFAIFNSSISANGENLVYKKYCHIGFAADTPNGLVVPVIRNVDQKGIFAIAQEMSELAKLAREGKLKPEQMQGGCFSVSSLGGIGGTYFTPIINAPEVAIMGVGKASKQAVWQEESESFVPRLMLPLSLSWDHRVIDGAQAARFNAYFAQLLADFRRIVL